MTTKLSNRDKDKNKSVAELQSFMLNKPRPDVTRLAKHSGYDFLVHHTWLKSGLPEKLTLDIGAGMGKFLIEEAERQPERRFMAIDPDYQCAKRVLEKIAKRQQKQPDLVERIRFYWGSAYHAFEDLPPESVDRAYINYPDPWFKKKHLKRRLVTPLLFEKLGQCLCKGAEIFIQTDIADYSEYIESFLPNLKAYRIICHAEPLFEDLPDTLYQEKAALKGHDRFCYHLTVL